MNRGALALIPAVLLALAGCTQTLEAVPEPTPSPSVNAAESICNEFSALTERVAELVVNIWTEQSAPGDEEELDGTGAKFDTLALGADGVVGERIAEVAEVTLDTSPIVMSLNPEGYFAALESVQRACDAEGVTIVIGTWS